MLDGVDLATLDDRRLTRLRRDKVGFVFQSFNLLPVLDARENVLLPLSIAHRRVDSAWFDQLVTTMGIADRLGHRPAELSGGQQQRVAVARALVSRPAVVFADEPTGNLDSKASQEVLTLLRSAVDDLGQTVVMVTHDAHAASFADRLVLLADGHVAHDGAAGTAEAVLDLVKEVGLMLRAMWRGFVSRKVRVGLTAIAVALGVALMAGTYILTDTINASFASIFDSTTAGISAVVSPHEALGDQNMAQISPITGPMLAKVRDVPGVAKAAGAIWDNATLLGPRGKSLDTSGPGFVSSVLPAPFSPAVQVEGRFPEHPYEVDIDEVTAQRAHLRLGQDVQVAGTGPVRRYDIVGTFRLAGVSTFGGASVAVLTMPEAQAAAGEVGRYDQIDVSAAPGVIPGQLRDRLEASLPASAVVRTGSAQAAQEESDVVSNLSFLRTFLLVFVYVALFVGAFIILNTFSITVAQRTRELGLMRAMGASRRQVLGSMVGESLLLGLVGSVVGLGLGLLVAPGLDKLFVSFGANVPDSGTVLQTRTVVVSLLAGVLTSLGAGLAPALRADGGAACRGPSRGRQA